MALLGHMLIAAGGGFIVHLTRRYYENVIIAAAILNLVSYSLGVLGVLPFAMLIWRHLSTEAGTREKRSDLFAASYLLAFLSFGIGVFVGWMVEPNER